jgi:DNA invertase Pin-like site-specific DNA recombinase
MENKADMGPHLMGNYYLQFVFIFSIIKEYEITYNDEDINKPLRQEEAVGYIRVSTDLQDVGKQRDIIRNWFRKEKIECYRFVEVDGMSSRASKEMRKLMFLNSLREGDMVMATELSRMSRSVVELVGMVSDLVRRKIRVVFIHNNLDLRDLSNPMTTFALHMLAAFAEMERNVISQRTKEALRMVKERGGRRKGV